MFVMQQGSHRTQSAGREEHMGRQATQGPGGVRGIPDGVSFQSHQELHTSSVPPDTIWERALEVQKKENNLAFDPQLVFR